MPESILLPRVLITNDDGIEALGIRLLAEIAREFAREIWIVAPEHEKSGAGQGITLCHPLQVWQRQERTWVTDGTPSDCVALALSHFMIDFPPSLVLSGVNPGMNAGDEVNMSGTLGAAFTAMSFDVPAIAVSQALPEGAGRDKTPWDTTLAVLPKVLRALLEQGWRKDTCLSVNIPALPADEITGFSWARQSMRSVEGLAVRKRISPRHEDYFWLTINRRLPSPCPNGEIAVMKRGEVAVTALGLDRSVDIGKPSVLFNDSDLHESEAVTAVNG